MSESFPLNSSTLSLSPSRSTSLTGKISKISSILLFSLFGSSWQNWSRRCFCSFQVAHSRLAFSVATCLDVPWTRHNFWTLVTSRYFLIQRITASMKGIIMIIPVANAHVSLLIAHREYLLFNNRHSAIINWESIENREAGRGNIEGHDGPFRVKCAANSSLRRQANWRPEWSPSSSFLSRPNSWHFVTFREMMSDSARFAHSLAFSDLREILWNWETWTFVRRHSPHFSASLAGVTLTRKFFQNSFLNAWPFAEYGASTVRASQRSVHLPKSIPMCVLLKNSWSSNIKTLMRDGDLSQYFAPINPSSSSLRVTPSPSSCNLSLIEENFSSIL